MSFSTLVLSGVIWYTDFEFHTHFAQLWIGARSMKSQYFFPWTFEAVELDGYLTLPYIDEAVCAKVNSIVKKSNLSLRVAWRNKNTLKKSLTRSAFSSPRCPSGARICNACESGLKGRCLTSGAVYKLTCVICEGRGEDVTYIGETKRPIRLRFNEHVLNAKNKTPETPIGDHFLESHRDHQHLRRDIPLSVEILQKTFDHPHRKICESLHIRQ